MKEIKLDPSPMKFTFVIDNSGGSPNKHFIDIAQTISTISRRTLRQGYVFGIKNINVLLPPSASSNLGINSFYVSTLPNTWVMAEAWKKAFTHWLEQQNSALDEVGSRDAVARSRDFKILADTDHLDNTVNGVSNLQPVMIGPGVGAILPSPTAILTNGGYTTQGDWEYSQVVLPTVNVGTEPLEPYLVAVGNDFATGDPLTPGRGIIKAYEESRSKPNDPEPNLPAQISTNLYTDMQESIYEGNEHIIDNAVDHNNFLPYDVDNYPGGANNARQLENVFWTLNTNTIGLREYNTGSFVAPCGLIRLDSFNNEENSFLPMVVTVEMCPGDYKGYLAMPMQEMN